MRTLYIHTCTCRHMDTRSERAREGGRERERERDLSHTTLYMYMHAYYAFIIHALIRVYKYTYSVPFVSSSYVVSVCNKF